MVSRTWKLEGILETVARNRRFETIYFIRIKCYERTAQRFILHKTDQKVFILGMQSESTNDTSVLLDLVNVHCVYVFTILFVLMLFINYIINIYKLYSKNEIHVHKVLLYGKIW